MLAEIIEKWLKEKLDSRMRMYSKKKLGEKLAEHLLTYEQYCFKCQHDELGKGCLLGDTDTCKQEAIMIQSHFTPKDGNQ